MFRKNLKKIYTERGFNTRLITDNNPKSPISETYRILRTNIEFSAIDENLKIIAVTSSGPSEGKTTTAVNLVIVNAQSEKKTLLIDCDLRKPMLHHMLGVSNRQGVSTLITTKGDWNKCIQRTKIQNLDVLTSGPIPPNPSELLGSEKMKQVLLELRNEYDMIIIDTPPVLAVTDTQIISTRGDGVVMVIDSGKVKRNAAKKMKYNLEHVGARVLGVVINNVDRTSDEYYYYYYYGQEYGVN